MKYGLLGETLTHSYSQIIHEKIGLYPYALVPMARDALDGFLGGRGFDGLNVTIPYKTVVSKYCDVVDPEAASIGSINTLYFKDGLLHGGNTDYFGLSHAVKRAGISLSGRKVLLLGGGGTAKTAAALVRDQGARSLAIAIRHPDTAAEVLGSPKSHEIQTAMVSPTTVVSYDNLPKDAEIIINTTPVGMFPNNMGTLLHPEEFPLCRGVVDVVYNPFSTPLVSEASLLGIPATGGLPMLVAQAVMSASLFTGRQDLTDRIEPITRQLTQELQNIVLIGMPGSGKSHLGKLLAKQMGRSFVDLDDEVAKLAGKPVSRIFADQGEEDFRRLETEVALQFGKKNRLVIAAGGGIVLRRLNVLGLKQNGILVHVDRPLGSLSTHGRPLSAGGTETLERLFLERSPLYEKYRDLYVANSQDLEGTLSALTTLLNHL